VIGPPKGSPEDHYGSSVGFFGDFLYTDGEWGPWNEDPVAGLYLGIRIDDSDIATIVSGGLIADAKGPCFLGLEPRDMYDDESANAPVDRTAEARHLAAWAAQGTGRRVRPWKIRRLMASPRGRMPRDVLVEETVIRLLRLLGLPRPDNFPDLQPRNWYLQGIVRR
jgi:hypothetical protein